MNSQEPYIEELYISDLAPEGQGLAMWARPDGLVRPCLVPNSLPGETVEATVIRTKKNKRANHAAQGATVKVASPFRVLPRCAHFGSCGGCVWQHMDYQEQLRTKEARLRALFGNEAPILPIMGCSDPWQYRNKMEFSFSQDSKGNKYLGLILQGSKGRVFCLEECHLMNPWVAQTVKAISDWWLASGLLAYYLPKNLGSLRNLTVREAHSSGDRVIILTVSGNPDFALKRPELDSFVAACMSVAAPHEGATVSIILRIQQTIKGSQTQFFEMVLSGPAYFRERVKGLTQDFEFHLSPGSFFQPNYLLANTLYQKVLEMAELTSEKVLFDLYAGIGIFGMLASTLVKEAIAIELSADSAYDARVNGERLKLANFRIIQGDVAKVLAEEGLPKADVAIVDPPRGGLTKAAIGNILKLSPKLLVYVSCNPTTQALDVKELMQAGMKLKSLQPIDQFPHTIHMENIAVLHF